MVWLRPDLKLMTVSIRVQTLLEIAYGTERIGKQAKVVKRPTLGTKTY